MKRIELKIPTLEDMHYRQKWMKDPSTMSYNAGFEINLPGYDYETGTISKNDDGIKTWYKKWIGHEPNKFFAYIYEINECSLLEKFIFIRMKINIRWEY